MRLSFDRSKPGVWISGAVHAGLILAALFAVADALPDADEGIPVEVMTDAQFAEMTKGEKSATQVRPDAKPRVDRVADTRQERDPGEAKQDAPAPPKRPVDMKVAEEETPPPPPPQRVADAKPPEAAPPAPPSRPEPPKPDAAKADAAKAEAAAKADAAKQAAKAAALKLAEAREAEAVEDARREAAEKAQEAKARADAKAKAEAAKAKAEADAKAALDTKMKAVAAADAKAEADAKAKALAEAKAAAEAQARAKALAAAKAKADAEAKARRQAEAAEKFNAGDIRQLLASKAPSQTTGSTGAEVQRTASLGTATATGQRLNPSQRSQLVGLLSDQLHKCWQVPIAAQSADKPPVPTVRVQLKPDGTLAADPVVMNSGDGLFRTVAESATRATRRCAPLKIPAQFAPFYSDWKDLVVNFDPRDVG